MSRPSSVEVHNQRVSALTVRVLTAGFERVLSDDEQIVPATNVVVSVAGARSKNVRLDGRALRLSSGEPGLLAVDMVRSTGFHRLVVDDCRRPRKTARRRPRICPLAVMRTAQ